MAKRRRTNQQIKADIQKLEEFWLKYRGRIISMAELAKTQGLSEAQLDYTLKVMKERSVEEAAMAKEIKDSVNHLSKLTKTAAKQKDLFFSTSSKLGIKYSPSKVSGLFIDPTSLDFILEQGAFNPRPFDIIYWIEKKITRNFCKVKYAKYLVLSVATQKSNKQISVIVLDCFECSEEEMEKKLEYYISDGIDRYIISRV